MDNVEQWDENEQVIGKQRGRRGSQSDLRYYNANGSTKEKTKILSEYVLNNIRNGHLQKSVRNQNH